MAETGACVYLSGRSVAVLAAMAVVVLVACSSGTVPEPLIEATGVPDAVTAPTATVRSPSPTATSVPVPTPSPTTAAPTPTRTPVGPIEGVFLGLLGRIPVLETEQFVLVLNDFTKVQEALGISPADFPGGEDGVVDYVLTIRGPSDNRLDLISSLPAITGFGSFLNTGNMGLEGRKYFGFDFRDVSSSAVLNVAPESADRKIQVTLGEISGELASDLLAACGECIQPELPVHNGVEYQAWSRNTRRARDLPPLFGANVFPTRLIINDGVALQAIDDAGIEALIDLSLGLSDSMADDDDIVALVTAMDEYEASVVVISSPGFTLDKLLERYATYEIPEIEEFATMAPLLWPYLAAATGVGRDAEGLFNVVALVHESEGAAQENAARLPVRIRDVVQQRSSRLGLVRWSEQIASVETVVDGRVLIARLRPFEGRFRPIIQEPNIHQSGKINLLIHE